MKQNCVTTTMDLLTSQGGWFIAPGPGVATRRINLGARAHNVGVGGEAVGAKHFVLTVSQEVRYPKPPIFV